MTGYSKSVGYHSKHVTKKHEHEKRKYKGIIGVNIGANKSSKGIQRINDYLICLEKVHKYADYITINISSPNTPNLRDLHNLDELIGCRLIWLIKLLYMSPYK